MTVRVLPSRSAQLGPWGEDETLTTHCLKMAERGDGLWIDAAVAAVLAHEARAHAIEHGALEPADHGGWIMCL